jgi:prepilin-type processing-associated H-X9-DG protein
MPNDIQVGLLYQYDRSINIYACPANTVKIGPISPLEALVALQNGYTWIKANGYVPQTRTCSIDFALGGFNAAILTATPPGLAQGGVSYGGITTLAKFSQIQLNCHGGVANKFVFADESANSVGDGCLATYAANQNQDIYWNLPGSRHNRGTTWSFADGHVEYWKWHGATIITDGLIPFNSTQAQGYNASGNWPADPLTGPGSSDDLPRVEAATITNGSP